jgi:hypothetical protein
VKKRTFVTIALALAFVLSLAAPAFAQSMDYSADYNFNGTIDQEMQVGHLCNTGAEMKQTITGTGTMTKSFDAAMVQGRLTVSDTNDWVTAPDAVRNLTVTSVIELCAPPKMTYADTIDGLDFSGVVHPTGWYLWENMPRYWMGDDWEGVNSPQEAFDGLGDFDAVSRQIWAVQVEAAAGFSGNLHQNFEAAYGPYYGEEWIEEDGDLPEGFENRFGFDVNGDPVVGADYVGNYFDITQFARTSQGVVRQFVDISSPWSHGYVYIDSTITGMSEISEAFSMDNLPIGADMESDWWVLF